jgi:UDP-N-acetylmuramyl-tripeptide synthetase
VNGLRRTLDEVPGVLAVARVRGRLDGREVRGITADSREVRRGSVFVCLKGTRHDGHAFVEKAVLDGAVAVVAGIPLRCTAPVVTVPDTREALARLSAWCRGWPGRALDVVGVTGTNGKTTTTYLLESILRAAGRRPALFGTVENRIGARRLAHTHTTPDAPALQSLLADARDAGADAAVIEVSSHALDQRRVDAVPFRAAVFTNLTRDHLDDHRTMRAYGGAKARLFDLVDGAERGGVAAVNLDDPAGPRLARRTRAMAIGFTRAGRRGARVAGGRVTLSARGTAFDLREGPRALRVRLRLLGDYNVSNALAAAAAARGLGIGLDVVRRGLERLARVPGRFERVALPAPFTVVVDYAHTPDALERVLRAARGLRPRRLFAVFGCGGNRDRGKRPRMGAIAARLADFAWVTSDNPRDEDPAAIIGDVTAGIRRSGRHAVEPDRRRAIGAALRAARAGDLVVIAGKGHERAQIVRGRSLPFDDARVAATEWRRARAAGA